MPNLITEKNWLYNEKHILPFLKNNEEAKLFTAKSGKKIECVCTNCGKEKSYIIQNLTKRGFSCDKCSNKLSYPEKLMMAILDSLNITYETQKKFNELGNKRFDFYLPDYKRCIEMNGRQHYETVKIMSHKNAKQSDNEKRYFCKSNKLELSEINCSKSEFEYILKEVAKDKFFTTFCFDYISIKECLAKITIEPQILKVVELYELGNTTDDISLKLNVSKTKVNGILKRQGVALRDGGIQRRKVICLNTKEIFESVSEAARFANLKNNVNISSACQGKQSSAGKHPITKEKLKWKYYDEYIDDIV